MFRSQVIKRLIVALSLVLTSLALSVNSVSADDPATLTVTYDTGGGSSITATSTTTGGSVADPGVPTRAGYTFNRWRPAGSPMTVSAGEVHSCAVLAGGTVSCWGDNDNGQTTVPAGITTAIAVSAGNLHSCALLDGGTVTCWGNNYLGQTSVPAGLTTATAVSTGYGHSCALLANGTVRCWGSNVYRTASGITSGAAGFTSAIAVSASEGHSCVVLANGTVTCWGFNDKGQTTVPAGITTAIAVSAGVTHSCALLANGTVRCWGDNWYGQSAVPAGLTTATAIDTERYHSCALLANGTVSCWGTSNFGASSAPAGITTATAIATERERSCALLADGTVTCWGYSGYGQVPAGLTTATAISSWPYTHGQLSDFTLYTQSTANTLVVTLDTQSGSNMDQLRTTSSGLLADPGVPTRAGYRFDGWYTEASGGTLVTYPYTHGQTSDFTLYARWTLAVIVSFNSGGGSSVASASAPVGGTVADPGVPTRAGYTFDAWYTAASGGTLVTYPYTHGQTSDFTLYARWTANTLLVTFDTQGGSSIAATSTTTGGTVADPGIPTSSSLVFRGWYTAASGGTLVTYPYTHGRTSDFTLYARMTNPIVSFNSGGGSSVASASAPVGGTVADPGVPTRAGYTFDAWYTAASGGTLVTYPYTHGQTSDFTLYARWTANTLAVTLDTQGGSSIAATSTTTGGTVADPGVPTHSTLGFAGWFTAASGGTRVTYPYTHGRTSDFTLYAQWGQILAVTYDSAGGSTVAATSTAIGGTVADPGVPTRAGYTFDAWWSRGSGTATAISVGLNHSCALLPNGTVTCWGNNFSGQTNVPASVTTATAISAGAAHSCVVLANRTVTCWGYNNKGQTTVPAGITTAIAVSAGGSHSCALLADSTVTCWGNNGGGQRTVPAGITTATALATGDSHSCALLADRTVTCWGSNTSGQRTVPAGLTTATAISASYNHTCALLADRTVTCWGDNDSGMSTVPAGITTATAVSAGRAQTCVLLADGTVTCWGREFGSLTSTKPAGLPSATAISAQWHACALLADGTVTCWGYNNYGQTTVPASIASAKAISSYPYTHGESNAFTLYARWTVKTDLDVSYDTGGGSSIAATSTTTGGTVADPGVPTRTGYSLDGWYTAASGGTLVTYPYTHGRTVDFTLYARWTANTLAVKYDSGGGSSVADTSTTTGGTVANPVVPTRPGYTFDAWYTAASGGTLVTYPYTHGRTSGFTLYARWTVKTLAVTYDSAGGSSVAATSTTTGGSVADPGVPTRPGYAFDGWFDGTVSAISANWKHSCALLAGGTVTCWGSNERGQINVPAGVTSATAISAGGEHSCALLANRTVTCWGLNTSGQTTVPAGVTSATAISAGGEHSCALLADRTVTCWGSNADGQRTVPAGITTATAISSGYYHSCALLDGGTVKCWGWNDSGQTTVPAGITTATAVSAGGEHSCALLADRTVTCWGLNTSGQTAVPAGISTAAAISAGGDHSCALLADGTVRCWGSNADGQRTVPAGMTTATAISAGYYHSCALLDGGTVKCWGFNDDGQASVPTGLTTATAITSWPYTHGRTSDFTLYARWTINALAVTYDSGGGSSVATTSTTFGGSVADPGVPTRPGYTFTGWDSRHQIAVSAGSSHSCALLAGGTVTCWGSNTSGQTSVPAGVTSATAVSAGSSHSCALLAGGTVTCWGNNSNGQTSVPVSVTSATAISAGNLHSCALLASRAVKCWGSNASGQTSVPTGLTTVTAISAGGSHSCALLVDGTVRCWGSNTAWQRTVPAGVTSATAVSVGTSHSCALLTDGTVTCWGLNTSGQTSVPAGLTTATAVSAGYNSSCALLADGTVSCWGYDVSGRTTVPMGGLIKSWPYTHGTTVSFTLYARWTANTLVVTYNTSGGSAVPSSSTKTGAAAWSSGFVPRTPTRNGYAFAAWYTAARDGTQVVAGYMHGNTSNFTLYARWNPLPLTITYDTGEGDTITPPSITYTGDYYWFPGWYPTPPTRAGYAFSGWYTKATGGSRVLGKVRHGKTRNFTLYARWRQLN